MAQCNETREGKNIASMCPESQPEGGPCWFVRVAGGDSVAQAGEAETIPVVFDKRRGLFPGQVNITIRKGCL